jgi:hypothetical protein
MHFARRTVWSHTVRRSLKGCAMTTIVTILPCGHSKPPALSVSHSMSDQAGNNMCCTEYSTLSYLKSPWRLRLCQASPSSLFFCKTLLLGSNPTIYCIVCSTLDQRDLKDIFGCILVIVFSDQVSHWHPLTFYFARAFVSVILTSLLLFTCVIPRPFKQYVSNHPIPYIELLYEWPDGTCPHAPVLSYLSGPVLSYWIVLLPL